MIMERQLFDEIYELPNVEFKQQYDDLIGLDKTKDLLLKEGRLLLNPELLNSWSQKHHGSILPGVEEFQKRPPLLLFAGDVGTGKTALASSFGDPIAREERITIKVMRLSLITRGRGAVGEMTTLITRAFDEVETGAKRGFTLGKKPRSAIILIIDEADSLAESRSVDQMHHEDKAGVNALIRGVDRFTSNPLPVLVVLCTNRQDAMDPAVLRRAASLFRFARPNEAQIVFLLKKSLANTLSRDEYSQIARLMLPNKQCSFGYTFSDITQRYLPNLLLEAFPDRAITFDLAASIAKSIEPTKPFNDE